VQVEVQAPVTNNEEQDRETASYAYKLLDRLASQAAKSTAPSDNISHREFDSQSAATVTPIKPRRVTAASKTSPVPAVIAKIDRMKTRQGDSLFLKVDVNGETVRVFAPGRTGRASGSERLRHPGERNRSRNGTASSLPGETRSRQQRIQDHRRVLDRSCRLTKAVPTCSESDR